MVSDPIRQLEDETALNAKLVSGVSSAQLGASTPCTGWDVRALINHMCLGNHFVAEAVDGKDAVPQYERDFVGDDPSGAYERARDDVLRAFRAPGALERTVRFPGMEIPAAVALGIALMDTIVHRWDLGRAIGAEPQISPEAAEALLAQARGFVPDALRAASAEEATSSIPFGPVVEVPETASPVDKLVAFLGRKP